MHDTRQVFLDTYRSLAPLIASPALDARWDTASVLKDFSIRGLAGHLVRAGWAVLDYLGAETPDEDPIPAPRYYEQVLTAMGTEEHEQVRTKGEALAGVSTEQLRENYADACTGLEATLGSEPDGRKLRVFGGHVMLLEHYLETRIVEVLVHADDLAESLDVALPDLPPGAFELAIKHLVEVARLQHGDRAVLVALSRRERDTIDALRVF